MGFDLNPTALEREHYSQVKYFRYSDNNSSYRVTASYMGKEDKKSVVQKVE